MKTKKGSNKFRRRDAISFLIYYIDYFLNFYALVFSSVSLQLMLPLLPAQFDSAFILNAHLTLRATLAAISHSQTNFRDKCFCYVHPNKSMCDRTFLLLSWCLLVAFTTPLLKNNNSNNACSFPSKTFSHKFL